MINIIRISFIFLLLFSCNSFEKGDTKNNLSALEEGSISGSSLDESRLENPGQKNFVVINVLGATLYGQPTFNSEVLKNVKTGERFKTEEIIPTDEARKIGANFSLEGNWIKIEVSGLTGYMFSSDLSEKEFKVVKGEDGQLKIDFLGDLIQETSETKKVKTEHGEYDKIIETKEYENGTYSSSIFDGCFDHEIKFTNLSINEVYHQMAGNYGVVMNGKEFVVPEFQEKVGNEILFKGIGATMDLKLELLADGEFKVSSYNCT